MAGQFTSKPNKKDISNSTYCKTKCPYRNCRKECEKEGCKMDNLLKAYGFIGNSEFY